MDVLVCCNIDDRLLGCGDGVCFNLMMVVFCVCVWFCVCWLCWWFLLCCGWFWLLFC